MEKIELKDVLDAIERCVIRDFIKIYVELLKKAARYERRMTYEKAR